MVALKAKDGDVLFAIGGRSSFIGAIQLKRHRGLE